MGEEVSKDVSCSTCKSPLLRQRQVKEWEAALLCHSQAHILLFLLQSLCARKDSCLLCPLAPGFKALQNFNLHHSLNMAIRPGSCDRGTIEKKECSCWLDVPSLSKKLHKREKGFCFVLFCFNIHPFKKVKDVTAEAFLRSPRCQ